MIARVNTPARRARFRNACRGRWVLDALLPLDQQIFGKSQPGRFYAGQTLCTVGAYAVANGQAYMACGQTAEPLRGKGIGGRLIVQMANALAAEGEHPVFLCAPERVHFYTRLGFAKLGEYVRFAAP